MDNEAQLKAAADRIVQWAAQHPLSAEETETRYAHLLKDLPILTTSAKVERDLRARWSVFSLGRLAVRYWQDQVEAIAESLGAGALPSLAAARGAATAPTSNLPEHTLKADGRSGTACVKLSARPDQKTLDLALWLESKAGDSDLPYTVTVLDAAQQLISGPTAGTPRNVIRFQGITPAAEYTLIFETASERWEVRWGFSADE